MKKRKPSAGERIIASARQASAREELTYLRGRWLILAILGLTVVVKIIFFPLQTASFRSMSKMKKLQPHMEALKKTHSDDPQKLQLAMMELYKREKANPLSGCVPILLTIGQERVPGAAQDWVLEEAEDELIAEAMTL